MKHKQSSVKKNFAYQMIYEILALILPFVTSPYIARVIGPEGMGTYSYSYAVAYYFVLFSLLGIKNYGNREIARVRDHEEHLSAAFCNITAVHLLISVLVTVAYIGYVMTLGEHKLYAAIQFFFVLSGLFDISWFYFGIEHFKLTVARNIVIRILNVVCVFVFVHTPDDLWKYCLIMALGNLISQLTLWVPLRKYTKFVRPEWSKMKIHIRPLLILFVPAIAVSLYKYTGKIMIGLLNSKAQLGFYENAEKIINIPMTIIVSFGVVMLPKMSHLAASKNHKESRRYMSLSMEFVMCLAFGLTFGLLGVATVFAPVFWGVEFTVSGTLIMGLCVSIPFISFANVIRTQYLIPNAMDRDYLSSVIAGAVANLIINAILIPRFGAAGAVVGTVGAETTVCIWQTVVVRKALPLKKMTLSFLPFLPMGIVMFLVVYGIGRVMGTHVLTLMVQVVTGGVIYLLCCLAYFLYRKNEIVIRMLNGFRKKLKRS